MIQRIQSVYLFLSVVLTVAGLLFPLEMLRGEEAVSQSLVALAVSLGHGNVALIPCAWLGMLALVGNVTAFFSYKNRKRQMRLCRVTGLLLAVALVSLCVALFSRDILNGILPLLLYVASLVFTVLSRRAIKRDDDLVRAADRIR